MKIKKHILLLALLTLGIGTGAALAGDGETEDVGGSVIDTLTLKQGLDTVWVLVAACLVFFMQAGFGMVEAGFIRAKNTCNILTKNFLDFCMASLGFFLIGYALMFGEGNGLFGTEGWCLFGLPGRVGTLPLHTFWLFQAAFCGAAATIVAGGMAERMKFPAYLIYSFIISALVYPIVGHWVWRMARKRTNRFWGFCGFYCCAHGRRVRCSCGDDYSEAARREIRA